MVDKKFTKRQHYIPQFYLKGFSQDSSRLHVFDKNIEGPNHPKPFLTTIDWPRLELGRAAAKMLLGQIKNPGKTVRRPEVFTPTLLLRQSTAAPRA